MQAFTFVSIFQIAVVVMFVIRIANKQKQKNVSIHNKPVDNTRSEKIEQYYRAHPEKDPRKNMEVKTVPTQQKTQKTPRGNDPIFENVDLNKSKKSATSNLKTLKREFESNDDWLGKQMAEEKISQIMISDMFALKKEHMNDCDANRIKSEHIKRHGVD